MEWDTGKLLDGNPQINALRGIANIGSGDLTLSLFEWDPPAMVSWKMLNKDPSDYTP